MTYEKSRARNMADALSRRISHDAPGLNRSAIRDALSEFFNWQRTTELRLPSKSEVVEFLDAHIASRGASAACTDFAYLQIAAAHIWSTEETSHFGIALREARVDPKVAAVDEWGRAARAISNLPAAWQAALQSHLDQSREGGRKAKHVKIWSASHLAAVAHALKGWKTYCDAEGIAELPTGRNLNAYARMLAERGAASVSAMSVAHYLARIYTGFTTVIRPGFESEACEFVLRDWRERGDRQGTPTKTEKQLVSATVLYDLGFELMARARSRRMRGVRAALDYRNGILLAIAISLPQRARALSVLEFDQTLRLGEEGEIEVRIPGQFIKQPERHKKAHPYHKVLTNIGLFDALVEYATDYRPIFDTGKLLFSSMHAPMQGITEKQIGRLAGDVTLRELGVRISIHRFRDNVATEIGETMPNGGRLAPAVLGHRDIATTQRHYDHAEGVQVAREFADFIDERRSAPTELVL